MPVLTFGRTRKKYPVVFPYMFHIGCSHEREVVSEHSIALHKQVLNYFVKS